PITTAKGMLHKSRFGTVDVLLSPGPRSADLSFRPEFNDGQYMYDDSSYWKMREGGVDDLLAKHVSRLFIRDLHYASDHLLQQTKKDSKAESNGQEHFKRFLGCNRQNVCLYPPNIKTGSGWEVEFMSLEVQLTDEENAALITFMVLLSRAILSFRLNLYLPISMMDENTDRAQRVNAAKEQVFLFRRDLYTGRDGKSGGSGRIWRRMAPAADKDAPAARRGQSGFMVRDHRASSSSTLVDSQPYTAEYIELTLDEIMNGAPQFRVVGLLNAVRSYLSSLQLELDVEIKLRQQLKLIENRAKGQTSTLAAYIRGFVQKHPDYRQDSIVPPSINYDLMRTLHDIEDGKIKAPELLR
ncbi:glutamate--cysteine ligase, partial [Linderina pennispora]